MNQKTQDIAYRFLHLGIPTDRIQPDERHNDAFRMLTPDHAGNFKMQFHRFTPDSPLHPLIKAMPHVALRVDDLLKAV